MSVDFNLPPVELHQLDPGQLLRLRNLLALLGLHSPDRPTNDESVLAGWHDVCDDATLVTWLRQRCQEVDDEGVRQEEILDAAELDLAGGHLWRTNYDAMDPDKGWQVFCDCGWETQGLPHEDAAEEAAVEHERAARREAP